ncbi:c-type cytochrome [Ancylobacter sp. GSK1Z-4-2]|nr:cytochrome c peroxidase [Ancylobacter mangrovi]MCS0503240.1 c-type cytochrome [Ancylobacter mangrovi]
MAGAPAMAVSGVLSRADAYARADALTTLGRKMFFDPSLSASHALACASCHAPSAGFSPADAAPIRLGGPHLDQPGVRAVPSLTYIEVTPAFTEHEFDGEEEGDPSVDNGPTGGLDWDGRADRGRDQARFPLLAPNEMANASPAAVVASVRAAPYAGEVRALSGGGDDAALFRTVVAALEAFEQDPATFYPYTSKFDAYLAGKATLSDAEARGLKLFEDENKGNCASCHRSQVDATGTPPQFTDYGMIALGLPRNRAIPANKDPNYYDLGLCGPYRTDFAGEADYCGLFKTPSLRNVARRKTFFHNGAFTSLRDAVAFYVYRDVQPERFYPRRADGSVAIYDDLPERYRQNLNQDPPFGGKPGDRPALTEAEIDDVVAFLKTLDDGYQPPHAGGSSSR